ncbi:hypothetical protein L6452_32859 [Arctium lappa]|uniref:Uncharacterized protein n=1 Tax=Arctium lappa TaxID=4217 RepID=A0ACB8Z6D7_ARCLA|nr:hypothetical protein L6452_32859 [Arctium lappa]
MLVPMWNKVSTTLSSNIFLLTLLEICTNCRSILFYCDGWMICTRISSADYFHILICHFSFGSLLVEVSYEKMRLT